MYLYNVIVEDKGDREYIRRIVDAVYRGWATVSQHPLPWTYNIEVKPGKGLSYLVSPTHVVEHTGARSLLSLSAREVVRIINRARARLRLMVTWDTRGFYRLDEQGVRLKGYTIHPGYDTYLMHSNILELFNEYRGYTSRGYLLAVKRFRGLLELYSGPDIVARIYSNRETGGLDLKATYRQKHVNNLQLFLRENSSVLEEHIAISRNILDSIGKPDIVIVSFSGGKDSIVALDLAIRIYGKQLVHPIYVDTGVEFPQTKQYISEVEEYYGIDIVKAYAHIDKAIASKGLPQIHDRWCTGLKQKAFTEKLYEITRGYDKVLLVLGDRDAESSSRSRRPPIIDRGDYIEVYPIKQWGTIHVQHYILNNKLPLNKLYTVGFYRTGCYICPLLTPLEKHIMTRTLWGRNL